MDSPWRRASTQASSPRTRRTPGVSDLALCAEAAPRRNEDAGALRIINDSTAETDIEGSLQHKPDMSHFAPVRLNKFRGELNAANTPCALQMDLESRTRERALPQKRIAIYTGRPDGSGRGR